MVNANAQPWVDLRQTQWMQQRLDRLPAHWRQTAAAKHAKTARANLRDANLALLDPTDNPTRLSYAATDDDIRNAAERAAIAGWDLIAAARTPFTAHRILVEHCAAWGIKPPQLRDQAAPDPAIARMLCPIWWRRRLRSAHAQLVEHAAIQTGLVRRPLANYISEDGLSRYRDALKRTALALQHATATSDDGYTANLADISETTNANPAIRFAELITRTKGLEEAAIRAGHVADFWTLTAPSHYHPTTTTDRGPADNPRYSGATPRQAQDHLCAVWAKIRANLARANIQTAGLRVAEPHHDATPHWHLMVWMRAEDREKARAIARRHALKAFPTEPGAIAHRFKTIAIDRHRGSAAGYLVKYLTKHTTGKAMDDQRDHEGGSIAANIDRAAAWSSTWHIRQFQFWGAGPIGPWRELRRLEPLSDPATETLRQAADTANYAEYLRMTGYYPTKRKQNRIKCATPATIDDNTLALCTAGRRGAFRPETLTAIRASANYQPPTPWEPPENRYGEPARPPTTGILTPTAITTGIATRTAKFTTTTRPNEWVITWQPQGCRPPRTCGNNCNPQPPTGPPRKQPPKQNPPPPPTHHPTTYH